MDAVKRQLLYCLAAYRKGMLSASLDASLSEQDWSRLHQLAVAHKLTPVVFETLWQNTFFCRNNSKLLGTWRAETLLQAASQASCTQRIIRISGMLQENGIPHAVVKGVVCRELYSRPDLRVSSDEDLLISPKDKACCFLLFEQEGLQQIDNGSGEDVTHWQDPLSGLHIELHTQLFSSMCPEDAFLNQLFTEQLSHTVSMPLTGGTVQSFEPTYHFVFLVCHALKHFITGGFGIRTICDVISFAETYSAEIHRATVHVLLERVNGRVFLDQLFSIGEKWLSFDLEMSGWRYSSVPDADALLEDSLDAGIYGQSSMSRRHSAGIVLQAAERHSNKSRAFSIIFPNKERMVGKYPVLNKAPILLPACWTHRIGKYAIEVLYNKGKDNSPLESVAMGKKRMEMMVKYGVLPKGQKKN